MPGFVDVSNMSNRQIQRMGHQDDVDPRDSNYSYRNLAHRNPYGYSRRPVQSQPSQQYPVDQVWAAAAAAQRVNGEYVKEEQWMHNATPPYIAKRRNRDIMMDFLRGVETLTDQDREAGEQCRAFLKSDLTFRALKGRLTDFDQAVSKVLAVDQQFDIGTHRYELAIVASLPASVKRNQIRANTEERVKFATGGFVGQPGDKVTANVEVLSASFSQTYGCWFIRGITDADQPVFFSYREGKDAGTWLTIQGTVKAHRDNLTQLNRVRVL